MGVSNNLDFRIDDTPHTDHSFKVNNNNTDMRPIFGTSTQTRMPRFCSKIYKSQISQQISFLRILAFLDNMPLAGIFGTNLHNDLPNYPHVLHALNQSRLVQGDCQTLNLLRNLANPIAKWESTK